MSPLKSKKFKLLLTAMLLNLTATASGQSPILPIQQSTASLPLLGEAIRDPEALRSEVRDDLQASAIKRTIAEAEADLGRSRGDRQRDLTRTLLTNNATLVAYYEDVLNGKLSQEGNSASPTDLSNARRQVMKYAAEYAKLARTNSQKAWAKYHLNAQQYILSNGRARAVANLKTLAALNSSLKRRAELLVALHEIDAGGATTQNAAKSKLISLIGPLDLAGATVARLELARKLAGVNSRGQKIAPTSKGYRKYLNQVSQRVSGLGEGQRRAILAYSVGVWRAAEGKNGSWDNPPLQLANFGSLKELHGLQERQALSLWRNRAYSRAVTIYDQLAAAYQGEAQAALIDMRILEIRASEYNHTNRSRNYEVALQRMLAKYSDKEAEKKSIMSRYQQLIAQAISIAKSPKTNRQKRSEVIALIGRYTERVEDSEQRYRFVEVTGDLHALNKDHRQAVGVYLDLIMNGKVANKTSLYRKAVASQRVLANWPTSAPWSGIPQGDANERSQLLALHKEQLKLYPSNRPEWALLSHIGLLEVSLGNSKAAFALWEKAMAATPSNHQDARQAAGFMLDVHGRTKNWAGQERIARICIKTKIEPLRGNRSFNLVDLLAEALLNGGRELLDANKPKAARVKLAEFVAQFKSHARHDEGQFFLAHAYRGEGDHKRSISTLTNLTKAHPQSKYLARTLILGGDWGMAMALEEETIYFHQLYVEKFPRGEESIRIRDSLILLYQGRELVGQATDLLEDHARDNRIELSKRLDSALEMLALEERYGGNDKAFRASELVLSLAKGDTTAQAKALAFQVRFYNEQRNLQKMQQLEAVIAKVGGGGEAVEALAEARLYIALFIAQVEREEIQSVTLRDPLATLNQEYDFYLRIKKFFDRVCSAGESGYCAPAMLEISSKAADMKIRIEDINIADDLDKKTVDTFNNRKRAILTTLRNHNESYVLKANQVVKRGNTNPTYTEQVLWENSNDWNFDRITGEVGNGYIQFSPNLVIGE
jgi:hypothetical protein